MTNPRTLVVIDAPSNLGLRPPTPTSQPGCFKMPWVLHNAGIVGRLGARYEGTVVPPRYEAHVPEAGHDRNGAAIAEYSQRLAEVVRNTVAGGGFPVVLGGDCSILVGNALALRGLGTYGLVFVDAHSDYRHPGNSPAIGSAAGEDLAIVTGKGAPRLTGLGGSGPSIQPGHVVSVGILASDEDIPEMVRDGIHVVTNTDVVGGRDLLPAVRELESRTEGFWVHLDLDVVDRSEITAVDCPEDTGLSFDRLAALLRPIVQRSACVGIEFTIYDPDLDPGFHQGARVADLIVRLLG